MKKIVAIAVSLTAIVSGGFTLQAASPGEGGSAAAAAKEEEPCIAKADQGNISCIIREARLCSVLNLPDATSSGRYLKPSQDGFVILFIKGQFCNKGAAETTAALPVFLSVEKKQYEAKGLYFPGAKAMDYFIFLNPGEVYDFACYYFLPLTSIIGGKLLIPGGVPVAEAMVLPFDRTTTIHDVYTGRGVTDSPDGDEEK